MVKRIAKKVQKVLMKNLYLIGILICVISILGILYRFVPESNNLRILFGVLFSFFGIVFTIVAIIFPFVLIRKGLKYLFNAKNLLNLIGGYLLVTFVIILLFAQIYAIGTDLNMGYLTRGKCYDNFDKNIMLEDSRISTNYFYFSAITFFTVGYGDICPMGLHKEMSIINALVGHIFTTIILVIAISSFLEARKKD